MDRKTEVQTKLAKVAAFLEKEKLSGIILSRRDNFSWMTAGGTGHVGVNVDEAAVSLLVTPDKIELLTTNIENPRVNAEELSDLGITTHVWPWTQSKEAEVSAIINGRVFGSDNGIAGTRNVAGKFAPLRYTLLPSEIERYVQLGKDATVALETAACNVQPGQTEWEISALLAKELMSQGIEPTVNLVAADQRIHLYRHPIPTANKLQKHVMLVMCARRGGLVVAATRLVHFGPLPAEIRHKHQAVCNIEAALYAATRPGTPVGDILATAIAAYEANGYADEWKLHHQGGATGYNNREFLATPGGKAQVLAQQAFAWNPSITGAKSEDTILVDTTGYKMITVGDGSWPQINASYNGTSISRPDVLVL